MAILNVKLWGRTANSAKWLPDRAAISIFPGENKGNIYVRTHEWVTESGDLKAKKIPVCIIEIDNQSNSFHWQGTMDELILKLK